MVVHPTSGPASNAAVCHGTFLAEATSSTIALRRQRGPLLFLRVSGTYLGPPDVVTTRSRVSVSLARAVGSSVEVWLTVVGCRSLAHTSLAPTLLHSTPARRPIA